MVASFEPLVRVGLASVKPRGAGDGEMGNIWREKAATTQRRPSKLVLSFPSLDCPQSTSEYSEEGISWWDLEFWRPEMP